MKHIKIAFIDFWQGFDYSIMNFYLALTERYEVEIMSDYRDADYIFFSCFGDMHWEVPLTKVKIFVTAENICPDFNTCDYAIGFEWMDYGDRYLRLSNAYSTKYCKEIFELVEHKHEYTLINKNSFCGFVVSNAFAAELRVQLFEKLSKYKKIDSGGRWMNNIGGPVTNKLEFDRQHKFSICCENSSHSGYTTEKLPQALAAQLVPIYWGDPDVSKVYNPRAFIDISNFKSLDEAVQYIIRVDQDEALYNAMIAEPSLLHPNKDRYDVVVEKLKQFMWHIFDQPLQDAYRYNRQVFHYYYPAKIANYLRRSRVNPMKLVMIDYFAKIARLRNRFLQKK